MRIVLWLGLAILALSGVWLLEVAADVSQALAVLFR